MKWRKIKIAAITGIITGVVLAVFLGVANFYAHNSFPVGTSVAGVDLSYKEVEESKEVLAIKAEEYAKSTITLTIGEESKEITTEELGIKIFPNETIDAIKSSFSGAIMPTNSDLIVMVDTVSLEKTLNKAFDLESKSPKSATFVFDKNKLSIADGVTGTVANTENLIATLRARAKSLSTEPVSVSTEQKEPAVTKADLEAQKRAIQESLNFQINLADPVYSTGWSVKLKDHIDWVKFVQKTSVKIPFLGANIVVDYTGDTPPPNSFVAMEINQSELDKFIDEKISKWLDRAPEDVTIATDSAGKTTIEGKGEDGLKIQREQLAKAIELAVSNKIKTVPIPVITISPKISISEDLRARGIKERISVGHTSYYGSPANRVHNIKIGAANFNGMIIKAGETFSFNKNLGKVDASTGYKEELVIKKEGTIPEYGGGLCQVSTTMYRTALFAALPIVERNEHTYAVSYYSQILGHGLDATIYLGGADLRFLNDTGGDILIQAYTENDYELYIVFYGTNTGKIVKMEGPYLSNHVNPPATVYVDTTKLPTGKTKIAEHAHPGFRALWYRYITDALGNVTKEEIRTNYKAMPEKVLVGVDPGKVEEQAAQQQK